MYKVAGEAALAETAGIGSLTQESLVVTPDKPQRIAGYDVARAVAVMGMVLVNSYCILLNSRREPVWFVELVDFIYGRAAVLFVMLAGVGLSLLARKAILAADGVKLQKVRSMLFKRSIVLFAMGLLFLRWWEADILHFYGIFLSTGALLLTAPSRWLWGLILTLWLSSSIYFVSLESDLVLASFDMGGSLLFKAVDELFLFGDYAAFPWLMFLLIGLWLGRHEVMADSRLQRRLLVLAALLFVLSESLSGYLLPALAARAGLDDNELVTMLIMSNPFPVSPLFALSAAGTALFVLMATLILGRSPLFARFLRLLQQAGKLSLTFYVTHIVLFLWLKAVLAESVRHEFYPLLAIGLSFGFCVFVLVFAHFWCRHYKLGPLEWLLRRLSTSI